MPIDLPVAGHVERVDPPPLANEFMVLTRVDGTPVAVRRNTVVAFVDATTHERPAVALYVYGKDDPIVVRATFAQVCRMFGMPVPPKPERAEREGS